MNSHPESSPFPVDLACPKGHEKPTEEDSTHCPHCGTKLVKATDIIVPGTPPVRDMRQF